MEQENNFFKNLLNQALKVQLTRSTQPKSQPEQTDNNAGQNNNAANFLNQANNIFNNIFTSQNQNYT